MQDYAAPLRDMQFILRELAGLEALAALPGCDEAQPDVVAAILEEAGKFATGVLAPINRAGDVQGCQIEADGRVRCADGWQVAWKQFAEAGWVGLSLPREYGGQGLPKVVSTPVWEMWFATNMAFAMLPQLNTGQAEALKIAASDELKRTWLPKVVSGEWGSTMNLTEPQAGSDLAATRTRAELAPDGTYRVFGQKIFISWGEHELTENIVHLVLARLPDAPAGVKGLSLFLVPKYLLDANGRPDHRNDVRCIAIEHKMGIHGSPTCTMSYGDAGGAVGYLVGEPNRGLETMFIMMNEARFGVGVQGVGLAERAYQMALAYAQERVQGRDAISGETDSPILCHPDVQRMLLSMRARIMAMRALLYTAAGWFDTRDHHPDVGARHRAVRLIDLMMPVAKGWCTEVGQAICSEAIQVFGGMGYVEETGIAQFARDARIITIYEGTTGIQANDLIGRKILRDGGETIREFMQELRETASTVQSYPDLADLGECLNECAGTLSEACEWLLANGPRQPSWVLASAVPFLHLLGTVAGCWQMARIAHAARGRIEDDPGKSLQYEESLIAMARFFMATHGPEAAARLRTIREAGVALEDFAASAWRG